MYEASMYPRTICAAHTYCVSSQNSTLYLIVPFYKNAYGGNAASSNSSFFHHRGFERNGTEKWMK